MVTRLRRAHRLYIVALLMSATLALPATARSAEPQVGVVAMLLGTAMVTRAALSGPAPLRFKDDVLLRDRITTAEKSAVRVLLGGKATVTAREMSVLTITEVPGTSTISLTAGRTAVAVSKARMKPGETIEIKPPNAVVAVRGTFVIAEVSPGRSTITIARGLVEVTQPHGRARRERPEPAHSHGDADGHQQPSPRTTAQAVARRPSAPSTGYSITGLAAAEAFFGGGARAKPRASVTSARGVERRKDSHARECSRVRPR